MIPDGSERELLAYAVNKRRPEDLILRLFVNDYVPTQRDEVKAFVEAEGAGYAPITLRGAQWEIDDAALYPEQTFLFTAAAGPIFGYYFTRAKSGMLAWAGRFVDAPYTVRRAGDRIKVIAELQLRRYQLDLSVRSTLVGRA